MRFQFRFLCLHSHSHMNMNFCAFSGIQFRREFKIGKEGKVTSCGVSTLLLLRMELIKYHVVANTLKVH